MISRGRRAALVLLGIGLSACTSATPTAHVSPTPVSRVSPAPTEAPAPPASFPSPSPTAAPPAYTIVGAEIFSPTFATVTAEIHGQRHMYLTHSAGARWREITPPDQQLPTGTGWCGETACTFDLRSKLETSRFLDAMHGYTTVYAGPDEAFYLLVTSDAGLHWRATAAGGRSHHAGDDFEVQVPDIWHAFSINIVQVAPFAYVRRSSDGGRTFEAGTRFDGRLGNLPSTIPPLFWSSRDGWARSYDGDRYFTTHDAGTTWQETPLSNITGAPVQRVSDLPSFIAGVGVLTLHTTAGDTVTDYVARSYDRGDHWTVIRKLDAGPRTLRRSGSSLQAISSSTWVVGTASGYRVTTDSGATWADVAVAGLPEWETRDPSGFSIGPDLQMASATAGLIFGRVGDVRRVFYTADRGAHWKEWTPGK